MATCTCVDVPVDIPVLVVIQNYKTFSCVTCSIGAIHVHTPVAVESNQVKLFIAPTHDFLTLHKKQVAKNTYPGVHWACMHFLELIAS